MKHTTTLGIARLSVAIAFACMLTGTNAPSAHAFGLGGGTTADVKSTAAIRALYVQFEKDWNDHNVAKMSGLWAIDGDHVEPDGTVAKGRDEVTALLTKQHAGPFKNSTLKLTVKSVWMMTDTVALVDGTYELSGIRTPDGRDIPPRQGMLTSVLLLDKNSWQVAASRLMIPTTLPYKPAAGAAGTAPSAPAAPAGK
jgi:uncharacterized protein (TIGR02246 family)